MPAVQVEHIVKTFGETRAVDDVSFEVGQGEIFGLLGPNGAGKTTTIRMLLDLYKPDSGRIAVLGGPMDEPKKARIGYMPEERGLYQDVPLERCLRFLAGLKGVPAGEARARVEEHLRQFNLLEYRKKKIKTLSKGMQQKAQIIATILHRPDLLLIDEPFAALDPLNVQMVKDILRDLRGKGVTIIMSTHQMNQVEELCDRILLIHHGRAMLYGGLDEVRRRFSGHAVLVRAAGSLDDLTGVIERIPQRDFVRLNLAGHVSPDDILRELVARRIPVEKFEIALPSLDEIFIRVVEQGIPA